MTEENSGFHCTVLVSGSEAAVEWVLEAERVISVVAGRMSEAGIAPPRCEVSVLLVGEDEIRDLNRRYRGNDVATDVLSFPQLEEDPHVAESWPADLPVPLGDIVVSIPRAIQQAQEFGHGQDREFGFLLVHGLLHLLGFDHEAPVESERMREREENLLAAAGLTRGDDPR